MAHPLGTSYRVDKASRAPSESFLGVGASELDHQGHLGEGDRKAEPATPLDSPFVGVVDYSFE
jgi:hypothetical protein